MYFDSIAEKWDRVTGGDGGAFKRLVLNRALLELIGDIRGKSVLELGAGNGYFARKLAKLSPRRLVVTDGSEKLLQIARGRWKAFGADYRLLDIRRPFPFEAAEFNLVLATMILNEVKTRGVDVALGECARVLTATGRLLFTITHPAFIQSLFRRGQLRESKGSLTMPGADGLRLPIVPREAAEYERLLQGHNFSFDIHDLMATEEVLREKPALRQLGRHPLARVYDCRHKTIRPEGGS